MFKNLKEQLKSVKEINDKTYLIFNGDYVGKLDNKISNKIFLDSTNSENKLTKISFIDNEGVYYNVQKFTNELPLIIDKIKSYFYLINTRYNIGEIDNVKYLYYEYSNEIPFSQFKDENKENFFVISNMRRIIIFQYLMCIKPLNCSIENNIFVRSNNPLITRPQECNFLLHFYTVNENDYFMDLNKGFEIPNTLINTWFDGDINIFNECISQSLKGIDANVLRNKLSDIVKFYNDDYKYWINSVYNRVLNFKNI